MDKKMIASQLNAASNVIQNAEGVELYTGILDVCGGLIHLIADRSYINKLSPDDLKDLSVSLNLIGKDLGSISDASAQTDCLKVNTQAIEKLEEALEDQKKLIQEKKHAEETLPAIEAAIAVLKPQAENLRKQYNDQEALKNSLEKTIEDCSAEKIEALRAENEFLAAEYSKLFETFSTLDDKRKANEETMQKLEAEIAKLPTEQELVKAYEEKKSELAKLQNAKTECCEEKQQELQNLIHDLHKEVEHLNEQMKILDQRKRNIEEAKTTIETEKGIFETNFIQKLEESMDDLKTNMATHMEKLNELKEAGKELKQHIEECDKIRKEYTFMFDTDNNPLEAIAMIIGMKEYKELSEHFDITKSEHVKELQKDIEEKLAELDQIVSDCTAVVSRDQKTLMNSVFPSRK